MIRKNKEIYEVSRKDYSAFVERLIPDKREIENGENEKIVSVFVRSKQTGKIWCEREWSKEEMEERYYIYDYPEPDEWTDAIGKLSIELTTKEEVQAVIDFLREHRNDGII